MVTASISPRVEEDRYLALLRAANAIATCSDCSTASDMLVKGLREVTPFDCLHVVAFDKETNVPDWCLLEINGQRMEVASGDAFSIADSPIGWVHESGQPLITADWSQEPRFQRYGRFLGEFGIASTCTLPLTRGPRHLGVLTLGRFYPNAYDQEEIGFLGLVQFYKVNERERLRRDEEWEDDGYVKSTGSSGENGDRSPGGTPKRRERIRPSGPWLACSFF